MASSLPSSSSSSSPSLWTEQQKKQQQPVPQPAPVDPYKELELYLEKAHEEIGAVFQQLEVSSRLRSETAASQALPKLKQPPPVPVRRHVPTPLFNLNQVIHNNINHIQNNNNNNNLINNWNKVVPKFATADAVGSAGDRSSNNGSKKRLGLRVTEEYYIGDLELASSRKHHWNSRGGEVSGSRGKELVAVDRSWNDSSSRNNAAVQRRISCPGLSSTPSSSPTSSAGLMMTTSSSFLAASDKCDAGATTAAVAATTTTATSDRAKKKNPRRQLRRYLTADSALQLTDNRRLLPPSASMSYQPQAIQLWTSSLMAEFNHIIDGEIQRLEGAAASPLPLPSSSATPSSVRTVHQRRLSPWARSQMNRIDPASSATVPLRASSSSNPATATACATRSNSAADIKKLTADIDLVERQILDDLDHITLTLNSQQQQLKKQTTTASTMTNTTTVVQMQPSKQKLKDGASSSSSPLLIPPPATKPLSSPLLRSHELQDFLRRVEDSIRTEEGTPPRPPPPSDDVDVDVTISKLMPETFLRDQVESPDAGVATASGSEVSNEDGMSPSPCQDQEPRPGTPTFDAGTQTSPMSLSRSSSFLWVSDCNCSGSLENAAVTTSAASLRRQSAASSQSGVSRIVHMDTSMSSLVSDPLRTPDSAADADEDEDIRSSSVSSIAHSLDDGRLDLELDHHISNVSGRKEDDVGGGAESGIGTGSPPPRDRRRRPLPPPPQTEVGPSDGNLSGEEENDSLDDEQVTFTTSSSSSSSSSSSPSTSSDEAAKRKKREKVRRRETWEKIRRRHSCKRVNSRLRAAQNIMKPEVVWIRRDAESPPPPPVPPHAIPLPSVVAAASATISSSFSIHKVPVPVPEDDETCIQQHSPTVATLQQQSAAQTPVEPVLHKPPVVVVVQSPVPRPKPRPLIFNSNESAVPTAASVKAALQSSLAMELNASAKSPYPSSSSSSKNGGGPFLRVGTKHLKPISASSTPTEPHMTLEIGLAAARSHSESAFAELEATEACRWLRATGFPQYAQMYEDWQFPLDLNVVERDHPFLDVDSLQALFRRLATLNRMARLRSEKARSRPQGDESDEEDQECALSDQWTFQRHSRRWSRIVDLPDGDQSGLLELEAAAAAAEDAHDGKRPINEDGQDASAGGGDQTADPVILGSFRRSSSERLRHGAKSLLRRMESLRSKNKRRPVAPSARLEGGGILISGPQLLDASGMEDRMKELNCVDLSSVDSANMSSSTPSPDLNRIKNESPSPVAVHATVTASSSAAINTSIEPLATPSPTPSPAGSVKTKSGKIFFGRRSFRPSVGSTTSTAGSEDQKDGAHSDSECSPSYWRRSPSATPMDANSNDTTTAAWNMFAAAGDGSSPAPTVVRSHQSQSLRWKSSKKSRDQLDSVFSGPSTGSGELTTTPSPRGKLYLNFNSSGKSKTKQRSSNTASPEDEDTMHSASTPIASSRYHAETTAVGTPSGSLLMETTFGIVGQHDSVSTGTGTSGGSHIDSDYSPATARAPLVVRWHSFRRSSSSSIKFNNQSIAIASLTVGQYAMLRKLALLRLTALLERNTASSKPSWGWDLPKFMRKTKVPDYKDKSMFGVPLSVTMQRTGEALPRPLLAALHYLRQFALDHIGLFRKSGVRSRITKLKELCEAWSLASANAAANGYDDDQQQPAPIDFGEHQSYDVADMVKQYFRELPEALMTNKLSETFVTIFQVVPVPQRLEALRCTMLLLPDEHREALQTFLGFLTDVAALASVNQMTPSNLAVCLAPSLFHLPATSSSNRVANVGVHISGNNNNASIGSGGVSSSSPRRRKTVGVPDQRELSQNKAAHECLLQMINDYRNLFTVPEDIFRQCRCTYLDDSIPVTLDDLHTVEFGDWQAYMNGCMAALLKETKDRSRGWESMSNDLRVDMAWKKVGDGHALRLWRISVDVEAPPAELMNRVLRERHLWDASLVKFRTVVRLDKKSDVVHYTTASEVPVCTRDFTVLRSWRNDLPRGTCLVAETSIEHADAPAPTQGAGVIRGIVLASRYLIQPCGAGKSRLIHLARVDVKGRSPDWYNKHYGHIGAMQVACLRDSFCHLVADGPESKV